MRRNRVNSSRFHFPLQTILGILFFVSGGILMAQMTGYVPEFIPQKVFMILSALGSFLGGIYLLIMKVHRPRVYL